MPAPPPSVQYQLPSSPIRHQTQNRIGDLRAYINWQIQQTPGNELILKNAYQLLNTQYYGLSQIRDWRRRNKNGWRLLGLLDGLGLRLADGVKAFLQERQLQSVRVQQTRVSGMDLLLQAASTASETPSYEQDVYTD